MNNKNLMRPVFRDPNKDLEEKAAEIEEKVTANILEGIKKSGLTAEPKVQEPPKSRILKTLEDIKKGQEANNRDSDRLQPRTVAGLPTTVELDLPHTDVKYTPVAPPGGLGVQGKGTAEEHNDIINCPTCHTGHVHIVEPNGVTFKCTGPNCGKEFVMVDKSSDYKCTNCGGPLKKPEDDKIKMDTCPFCHGAKAVKYPWAKIWNTTKK